MKRLSAILAGALSLLPASCSTKHNYSTHPTRLGEQLGELEEKTRTLYIVRPHSNEVWNKNNINPISFILPTTAFPEHIEIVQGNERSEVTDYTAHEIAASNDPSHKLLYIILRERPTASPLEITVRADNQKFSGRVSYQIK